MAEETFGDGMTAAQVAKYRRSKTDPHFSDTDNYRSKLDLSPDEQTANDVLEGMQALQQVVITLGAIAIVVIAAIVGLYWYFH